MAWVCAPLAARSLPLSATGPRMSVETNPAGPQDDVGRWGEVHAGPTARRETAHPVATVRRSERRGRSSFCGGDVHAAGLDLEWRDGRRKQDGDVGGGVFLHHRPVAGPSPGSGASRSASSKQASARSSSRFRSLADA